MTPPIDATTQDRQEARRAIHAELMAISRSLNAIHPSRQPEEARRLLARRRELQASYLAVAAAAVYDESCPCDE
jgi:hypothetical protein